MDQIVQLAVSLGAILGIVWLVARLKLGGDGQIGSEAEARELADEVASGFEPVAIAIDRSGHGALLRDGNDRIIMLRRHGSHFAGRMIGRQPQTTLDRNLLTIEAEDRPFGAVTLDLGDDAALWADDLQRMTA